MRRGPSGAFTPARASALVALAAAQTLACAHPDSPDPRHPEVSRREAKECRRLAEERGDAAHDAVMRGAPSVYVDGTGADDGINLGLAGAFAISRSGAAKRERERAHAEALSGCIERTADRAAGRAPLPEPPPSEPPPASAPAP